MSPLHLLEVINEPGGFVTGCAYHRQIVPNKALDRNYPIDILQVDDLLSEQPLRNGDGEEFSIATVLEWADVIHFGRVLDVQLRVQEVAALIKKAGKPIILDLDDYWNLSSKHILKAGYEKANQSEIIRQSIKLSDHVTVTTPFLAEKVKPFNSNVTVLENAIDPSEDQWNVSPIADEKNRTRFGWIGGSCHVEDIELVRDGLTKVWHDSDLKGLFQLVLGGFNVMDGKIVTNANGEQEMHRVSPLECIYTYFERCFTNEYKGLADGYPNYIKYLMAFDNETEAPELKQMPYRRIWAKDTFSYGSAYNHWDVTLIPLNDNTFNNSKSQLKMIESGFMGKAVIVSEVYPYLYETKSGVNCLAVRPGTGHKNWHKYIRKMINEPEMRKELAATLQKEMVAKYHIDVVNNKRWKLFCQVGGKPELMNHTRESLKHYS